MRLLTILIFFSTIFLFETLYAQETKLKDDYEQGEKYYVLKSNKKIKHGPFEKKGIKKHYVTGTYSNGKRSGIWEFYNIDGKLLSKYDFDKDSLLVFY